MIHRSVILRHTLPDGSWHRDWLIEPPGPMHADDERADLVSFRLPAEAPTPGIRGGSFECLRLPGHRRRYLRFEGEVSGGRGRVEREAEWGVRWESLSHSSAALWVVTPLGERRWLGTARGGGWWVWSG